MDHPSHPTAAAAAPIPTPDQQDILLTLLTLSTPPPPRRWEWPTDVFRETGIASALIVAWREHLLQTGQILKVPLIDEAQYWHPGAYMWAPKTTPNNKLHKVTVMTTKYERSSILQWLQDNTPAGEWWNMDKFRKTGKTDSYGTPLKDYNPIWLAMLQGGIKRNSAYAAVRRAADIGILDYDAKLGWRWRETQDGWNANKAVYAVTCAYLSLTKEEQHAAQACLGIGKATNTAATLGDYTATIDDLREVPLQPHDDPDNPFTPGHFVIDVTLRYKNKVIHRNTIKLLPTPEEEKEIAAQYGVSLHPTKKPTIKTYNDLVPGDTTDYSPEELRAIEANRHELEAIDEMDFYEDIAE